MNKEKQLMMQLLKSVGIVPSTPTTDFSDYYDGSGKRLTKKQLKTKEIVYDRAGNEMPNPVQRGLMDMALLPTSVGNVVQGTSTAVSEENPALGFILGVLSGRGGLSKPKPKSDNYYYGTNYNDSKKGYAGLPKTFDEFDRAPRFNIGNLAQKVKDKIYIAGRKQVMPVLDDADKLTEIPLEAYRGRINRANRELIKRGEKPFEDLLYDGEVDPVLGKLRNVYKDGYNRQFGAINLQMGDIDHFDIAGTLGSHHRKGQITLKDIGEVEEMLRKQVRDNPDRVYEFGPTGGGTRLFDISEVGEAERKALDVGARDRMLRDTRSDPDYRMFDTQRASKDKLSNNPWGIQSAVRYQAKVDRMKDLTNPEGTRGAPFTYQRLGIIGNPDMINKQALKVADRHMGLIRLLRKADNLEDPNNPLLGKGFTYSKYLDPMIGSLKNKTAELARQTWKLGVVPPALINQEQTGE